MTSRTSSRLAALALCAAASATALGQAAPASATPPVNRICEARQANVDFWAEMWSRTWSDYAYNNYYEALGRLAATPNCNQ